MRQKAALFLTALVLLNVTGGYIYFVLRSVQIKQEMRLQLQATPEASLHQIILTADAFRQAQVEDHEMRINGRMFDIAKIVDEGEAVRVFGLYDQAEDSLLGFLNTVVKRLDNDGQEIPIAILQFTLLTFLPAINSLEFSNRSESLMNFGEESIIYVSPLKETTSPPPRS